MLMAARLRIRREGVDDRQQGFAQRQQPGLEIALSGCGQCCGLPGIEEEPGRPEGFLQLRRGGRLPLGGNSLRQYLLDGGRQGLRQGQRDRALRDRAQIGEERGEAGLLLQHRAEQRTGDGARGRGRDDGSSRGRSGCR